MTAPITGFLPDSDGSPADNALPYTSNPWKLLLSDVLLIFKLAHYIPTVIFPIYTTDPLAELYLGNWRNVYDIVFHIVLVVLQTAFLVSLPICFLIPSGFFPAGSWVVYVVGFLVANHLVCKGLNGNQAIFESNKGLLKGRDEHADERWIFLNGISVGHHWLQANIDKLSIVFGRPILGVHNPTAGIIFDLLQCIVQRDFGYATQDIRDAYIAVKNALYATNPNTGQAYKKVIFIIHSQGAIEGGLLLDWLLADMPQEMLRKLEVYTFGNAANHFNNPMRVTPRSMRPMNSRRTRTWDGSPSDESDTDDSVSSDNGKAIAHIEHYANSGDFVAEWGVLHFASPTRPPAQNLLNTFVGKVFERPGNGHLLNQHYLDPMFTLDPRTGRVADHNPFMDMKVQLSPRGSSINSATHSSWHKPNNKGLNGIGGKMDGITRKLLDGELVEEPEVDGAVKVLMDLGSPIEGKSVDGSVSLPRALTVKDMSRLWRYRNGMSPKD